MDCLTVSNTERRVLHAESVQTKSRNGAHVAHTLLTFPASHKLVFLRRQGVLASLPNTGGEIDLLEEGHLRNKGPRLLVGRGPVA